MNELKGPIYEITPGEVTVCRVWRSPDVDAEEGARCAARMAACLNTIFSGDRSCRGVLFDVREGPPAFGPKTQTQLTKMIEAAAAGQKTLSFLVSDSAIQQMQFRRLVTDLRAEHASVFTAESHAVEFARTRARSN